MRFFAAIALLALLPACQTTEQVNAERDAKCRSYGAAQGTDAYVNCRLVLEQQAAAEDARRSQSIIDGLAIANGVVNRPVAPSPTTCNTYYGYGTARTTCF